MQPGRPLPHSTAGSRMNGEPRDVANEYAVQCPRCRGQAVAWMVHTGKRGTYREVFLKAGALRITCNRCGFHREVPPEQADDHELWYVTVFEGHRLWATNRRHLDFLIAWLESGARVRNQTEGDQAYLEALPKWLRLVKNREAILERLQRLRDDG